MNRIAIIALACSLTAAAETFSIAYIADPSLGTNTPSISSSLTVNLATDRACYAPGATVYFRADQVPQGATVRYRHGADVIAEHPMESASWSWAPPATDFRGYMVDVYRSTGASDEEILGTIAVDVSSDWVRFPRYGFIATFDSSKQPSGVIEGEMAFLNRCHINGVQFQDWHQKHHWPLGGTRNNLLPEYTDIANRQIITDVIRRYIAVQHSYGMKSIFYNLAFGALSDAASDGVDDAWYLYRYPLRISRDCHELPAGWKSDIYLVNPANTGWQEYLGQRNDDVYANFDFDGFQIDQLGYRGTLYDASGAQVDLPEGYNSFIRAMKQKHPDKRLIMNAVSSYGADRILAPGLTDFAYNEPWSDESEYSHLHDIIRRNDGYSPGGIRTVFAAYMNYDLAGSTTGLFNTPGVLLTDAVMMALGGSHLELGDHMLSREYFPTAPLSMSDELRTAIVHYYDFMTAYQNLLRDGSTADEFQPQASATDYSLVAWPPQQGSITLYGRRHGDQRVYHLLNFLNADNTGWRDLNGTRPEPQLLSNLSLRIYSDITAHRVWVASPDLHGGVAIELPFTQSNGWLDIKLPSLKYWTMLVVE